LTHFGRADFRPYDENLLEFGPVMVEATFEVADLALEFGRLQEAD